MRRVRFKSVTPLWETNRWDGPLSGFCIFRGKPFHFHAQCELEDQSRKYVLHPISDESFEYHKARHEDFRKHIGTHCDYVKGFKRVAEPYVDRGTAGLFYGKYPATEQLPKDLDPRLNPPLWYFFVPERG